jgi:23S rRNA pseudouridine1911/1915/1917 synthase
MVNRLCFNFERGQASQRLDQFLALCSPELSRSQIKRLIESDQVLCNGETVKAGSKLKGGEVVTVTIPEPEPIEALPEAIPLTILYEDSDLIVIDKPAGMVVHPAPGHSNGTLVNALLHHCQDLSGIGGQIRPGIVHRLDRDTSGVMVATKNDATHQELAHQFKLHTIHRRYVALVFGQFDQENGTINKPIGRHPLHRKKMSGTTRHGRDAVTHWHVLQRFDSDRLTLVELRLETGRTHQIRVHLSEASHPVVGDPVYGTSRRCNQLPDTALRAMVQKLSRQFLHARLLGFKHPATGKEMTFEAAPPTDLQTIIDYLQHKHENNVEAVLNQSAEDK